MLIDLVDFHIFLSAFPSCDFAFYIKAHYGPYFIEMCNICQKSTKIIILLYLEKGVKTCILSKNNSKKCSYSYYQLFKPVSMTDTTHTSKIKHFKCLQTAIHIHTLKIYKHAHSRSFLLWLRSIVSIFLHCSTGPDTMSLFLEFFTDNMPSISWDSFSQLIHLS